jgi:hypothetical protein
MIIAGSDGCTFGRELYPKIGALNPAAAKHREKWRRKFYFIQNFFRYFL